MRRTAGMVAALVAMLGTALCATPLARANRFEKVEVRPTQKFVGLSPPLGERRTRTLYKKGTVIEARFRGDWRWARLEAESVDGRRFKIGQNALSTPSGEATLTLRLFTPRFATGERIRLFAVFGSKDGIQRLEFGERLTLGELTLPGPP